MRIFSLIIVLLAGYNCYSQKLNKIYHGISSDSLLNDHQLEFKNDSLLEISTFPRHMSQQFKMTFEYKWTDGILATQRTERNASDSLSLIGNGFEQFILPVQLTMDKKALIDEKNDIIYVVSKDFEKNGKLTYIVDEKTYQLDFGLTNSYGLLEKSPRDNKKLSKKMDSIKDDLNQYDIEVYKGLSAYRKYGYESVFGVVVISKKGTKTTSNNR
jgi:hypothetical protein